MVGHAGAVRLAVFMFADIPVRSSVGSLRAERRDEMLAALGSAAPAVSGVCVKTQLETAAF